MTVLAFRPFSTRWELSLNGKATSPAVGRLGLEGLNVTLLVFWDSSSGEGGSDVIVGMVRWL